MDIKDFPALPGEHPADHWRRWIADGVERGGQPPTLAWRFDTIRGQPAYDTAALILLPTAHDPNKRDDEDPHSWDARFRREEEERREPQGETQ